MPNPSHSLSLTPTWLLALSSLVAPAIAAQGQAAIEAPAPGAPQVVEVLADGPPERPAEILEGDAIGPVVIESMDAVLRRQEERGAENGPNPKARNDAQGEWEVPGMRWSQSPHSGSKHLINRWGDTRMGIGFGREVDLAGAWVAGQGTLGSWTSGLRAVGYRDGVEVARSDWFETIEAAPAWFEMDLEGVDRVVLVARPVLEGAGWYALDDLTFAAPGEDDTIEVVVLDFEDLDFRTRLTSSGYADLDWERGTGDFVQPTQEVPPPQVPPGTDLGREVSGSVPGAAKLGGGGTTPSFLREFQGPRSGDAGANLVPPDTCGAVGRDHFVSAVNANLSVYVKSTGTRVLNVSLASFWGTGGLGDPRVVYDSNHDRFALIASNFSNRVYFAYSLTGDPTGAWLKTSVNVAQGPDVGKWPDYPTLGVDAGGVYFAAFMVGGSARMSIFAVDKTPLLAATPTMGTVSAWRSLPWEGAIQPCVTFGDSGGVYLVSRRSSTTLRLRQITGPLTAPTLVEKGNAVVPSHGSAPNATQKGTGATLDTIDYRPMNAVYRNGSVWTTHCINVGGRAGVRWYEIAGTTAATLQHGTVSDSSLHYYMPAISVNASGDLLLGFSGSDAQTYAGAWLTGRAAGDPPGETGPPLLYFPGEAPYTQISSSGTNRWGDYSLTSVDPLDDETFWTIQEYARSNNTWGTRVGLAEYGCLVTSFCTGKVTSKLCAPFLSSAGHPSLALPSFFVVTSNSMDPNVSGIVFFGLNGPAAVPFQGGTLCVASPVWRLPGRSSGGSGSCTGSLNYTLADFLASPGGSQIAAGSQVHCQAWARDVGDPFGTSLSDGLSFEVCP